MSTLSPIAYRRIAAGLLLLGLGARAGAAEAPVAPTAPTAPTAPDPRTSLGAETRSWVELQRSGTQAADGPRPMPGEIADNVYQRYVDSFKQPIPAEFKRQSASESGNGSSQ